MYKVVLISHLLPKLQCLKNLCCTPSIVHYLFCLGLEIKLDDFWVLEKNVHHEWKMHTSDLFKCMSILKYTLYTVYCKNIHMTLTEFTFFFFFSSSSCRRDRNLWEPHSNKRKRKRSLYLHEQEGESSWKGEYLLVILLEKKALMLHSLD